MKKRIKSYQVLEEIATGGQATVYRVWDTRTSQILALKVMHPHLSRDPDYLRRFEREASLASSLDHPNVVRIFEVGKQGDSHFIAMEFLPMTLHHLLKVKGCLAVRRAVDIACQVSQGLEAASQNGIVHRDVKPQNILLGRKGVAKITDFGIARTEQLATMTHTGLVMGTPQYMAPEQARGLSPDIRSDIYSIGILLYQMLTGLLPFRGETPWEMIRQHIEERQEPVNSQRPEVPEGLSAIVDRCLQKEPDARYQSPLELARALEPYLAAPVPALEAGQDLTQDEGLAGETDIEPITLPLPSTTGHGRLLGQLSRNRVIALAIVGVIAVGMRFPAGGLLGVTGILGSDETPAVLSPTPTPAPPLPTRTPDAVPTPRPTATPSPTPTGILKVFDSILQGETRVIAFTFEETEKTGVTEVRLSAAENTPSAAITVDNVPGQFLGSPPGSTFSYVGISLTGAPETSVGAMAVRFRIPQTWLQERRLQPASVALYGFDGRWNRLPTRVLAEGSDDVTYSADATGYTLFAAAGMVSDPPTPTAVPTPMATPSPTPGPIPTPQPDRLVINHQGMGPVDSPTFIMTASPWKLQYRASWSGPLVLKINTKDGLKTIVDQKVQAEILYTTYVYGSEGPLTIVAGNAPAESRWAIWAVDHPRPEDSIPGGPDRATFSYTALSLAASPPLTMQSDPWLLHYWTSWSGPFTLKAVQEDKLTTLVDGTVAAGASYGTYIYGAAGSLHLVATNAPPGGRWIVWAVDNPRIQAFPGDPLIFTHTGTGTIKSPPFSASESPWRLVYTTSWSGPFVLTAVTGDDSQPLVKQDVQAGTVYETYVYGLAGRMYLSVDAAPPDGAWSVSITKNPARAAPSIPGGPPDATFAHTGTGNANSPPLEIKASKWKLVYSAQWTGRMTLRAGNRSLVSSEVVRGAVYVVTITDMNGPLYFTVSDAPPDGRWTVWIVEEQSSG